MATAEETTPRGPPRFTVLVISETISLLGDAFYLVALPWLVLSLTGDAALMAGVLAAAGLPRAALMLFGGVLFDRFDPLRVMLWSNCGRLILVATLAGLVAMGLRDVWPIFAISALFGISDAFFAPAKTGAAAYLLPPERLRSGNTILEGSAQLSTFLGPAIAGGLIALLGAARPGGHDVRSLAVPFALDSLTFGVSGLALVAILGPRQIRASRSGAYLSDLAEIFRFIRGRHDLRTLLLVIGAVSGGSAALLNVGLPLLAAKRLAGAQDLGILFSAIAGGAILGMVLTNVLPRPVEGRLGPLLMGLLAARSLAIVPLAWTSSLAPAVGLSLIMGILQGYAALSILTYVQLQTPPQLLGRMMSVLMFCVVGLTPLLTIVSGFAAKANLGLTLGAGGLILALAALIASGAPSIRRIKENNARA